MSRGSLGRLVDGLGFLGIDLRTFGRGVRGLGPYLRDLRMLRRQAHESGIDFPFGTPFPCLADRYADSGVAQGHYFHQDLLVARRIFRDQPRRHVDVGSRVDGFVAHVAAFREIEVVDIRPLDSKVPNIRFLQSDLMAELPPSLVECCDSLSCLHALEHFGLGRYGDPARFDGHLRGLANLTRMLEPGGKFHLSVPIGPQRIEFNAHRVFSVGRLLEMVRRDFRIESFSFVDDAGVLHEAVALDDVQVMNNYGCQYGCGILELRKSGR